MHNPDNSDNKMKGHIIMDDPHDNIMISFYRYLIWFGWKSIPKWHEGRYIYVYNKEINKYMDYLRTLGDIPI